MQEQRQQPSYVRCNVISRMVDECTIKDLEYKFPSIIEEIFGISNRVGWNLLNVEYGCNPHDFDNYYRFLNPTGAIFRLCYKLLSDPYIKYNLQLCYLPQSVRQAIEDRTASSFYMEKLVVDPRTRTPLHLALNPLELYMFHFMYHVVNPYLNTRCYQESRMYASVYLRLAEEYLCNFLPCDGSTVKPELSNHYISQSPHRSLPQSPVRTSQLFKQDVLATMLKQSPASPGIALQSTPHAAVWRSELVIQLCRDLWLDTPAPDCTPQLWSSDQDRLASYEQLYAVRLLVKHLHYFANSLVDDASPIDELKKVIGPSSQRYIYQFIHQTMQHWPLDSSFKQILEIWLSYIQPWRYVDFKTRFNRPKGETSPVDSRWFTFIYENILVYSTIFHLLIERFKMIDLASAKNAHMLFRLTKVFSQQNLPQLLRQVEERLELDGRSYSKWVRSNVFELEGQASNYKSIFQYDSTTEALMRAIKEAEQVAVLRAQKEQQREEQKSIWEWLTFSSSTDLFSNERKNVPVYLSASFKNLADIFQVPMDVIDSPAASAPGSTSPLSINEMLPPRMRKKLHEFKYEGDPDLQPIRSNELAFLVRMLYYICCWINYNYKEQLGELYMREDLVGGIVRQVLCSPQDIYFYDRSQRGMSPRVSDSLPPRLSLRWLADIHLIGYSTLILLLMKFSVGYSFLTVIVIILFLWITYMTIMSLLGLAPKKPIVNVHDISENNQDISLM